MQTFLNLPFLWLIIGFVPLFLGAWGAYKTFNGNTKWVNLIFLEILIFLASVLFIGAQPIGVTVAATICIFTSLIGIFTLLIGLIPIKCFSTHSFIMICISGYALGFFLAMIRCFIIFK